MYRYKNLHFRFSADTCTSTFVTANIFPWYLLIRENFANEAVPKEGYSSTRTALVASVLDKGSEILGVQFGGRDGVDSIAEGCAA